VPLYPPRDGGGVVGRMLTGQGGLGIVAMLLIAVFSIACCPCFASCRRILDARKPSRDRGVGVGTIIGTKKGPGNSLSIQ